MSALLALGAMGASTVAEAGATTATLWGVPVGSWVASDSGSVTLGTKFSPTVSGSVVGVRFWKGSTANSGVHVGALWTSGGTRLASVTFSGETSSGWQTATFSQPVAVSANTQYVVSYLAPKGRYSVTQNFTGASTSSYLTVPTTSSGVYTYGSTSTFPRNSYKSSQYWVDVVFQPSVTSTPTASPTPTATPNPTASPTPTPTTSPTPELCATAQVWSNLDQCGWPGPATTGHPDAQVFAQTITGGLTVTQSGAVIDGYKVTGGITVRASNVVIRNSWVTNSAGGTNGTGVIKILSGASATITDSVLDGLNATHACIWHEGASLTALRNECRGTNDGVFSWAVTPGADGTGDNFVMEDNWLHGFTTAAGNGHVDGYQTEGAKNGVIRHNVIDVAQDQTSAIAVWNSRKSADNILVERNLLRGGGFTVYAEDYSPSEASPAGGYSVTNVRFVNNTFSNARYACVGNWGVWFTRGAPTDGWRRTGNVLLETGQNLDAKNPIVDGWECR